MDRIYMTIDEFKNAFFSGNGLTFDINENVEKLKLSYMKVNNIPFHLSTEVLRCYSQELGIPEKNMDPCGVLELKKQLSQYKSISDFTESFTHISYEELILQIINSFPQGEDIELENTCHVILFSVYVKNNLELPDVILQLKYIVEFVPGDGLNEANEIKDRLSV